MKIEVKRDPNKRQLNRSKTGSVFYHNGEYCLLTALLRTNGSQYYCIVLRTGQITYIDCHAEIIVENNVTLVIE